MTNNGAAMKAGKFTCGLHEPGILHETRCLTVALSECQAGELPGSPGRPQDQEIHIVLDNYATHKHPNIWNGSTRRSGIFSISFLTVLPGLIWWKGFLGFCQTNDYAEAYLRR